MSSLRNMLQPVNTLPPEIISRIAQWTPNSADRDAMSIVPLTHVCRYWRSSIISAPGNWTRISGHSEALAALSLERSKAAPLKISLCMYDVEERFSGLLAPYIQNIVAFNLSEIGSPEDIMQNFPNFPCSTPNLRSLEMSLDDDDDDDLDISIDPFQPFPSTLRRLVLFGVPLYPTFLNLRTLTEFTLCDYVFALPLDTLLTMLEENRGLERVELSIEFTDPDLRGSQRRAPISNQFQHLSVSFSKAEDARPVISSIPIQRGANLALKSFDSTVGLSDVLSTISATHLANLPAPTYMNVCERYIRLSGSNGSFSFSSPSSSGMTLVGLPLLSFDKIRELHFRCPSRTFDPSLFPVLETLALEATNASKTLSTWLSSPKASPLLKTLAFLNCILSEEFMKVLTQFACDRRNAAVTWLYRVLIVDGLGEFPSPSSILGIKDYVQVVDFRVADSLPSDLT